VNNILFRITVPERESGKAHTNAQLPAIVRCAPLGGALGWADSPRRQQCSRRQRQRRALLQAPTPLLQSGGGVT
jgi:hypothetical protein